MLDNEIKRYTMTSMNINPIESINVRIIFRSALDKKSITDKVDKRSKEVELKPQI